MMRWLLTLVTIMALPQALLSSEVIEVIDRASSDKHALRSIVIERKHDAQILGDFTVIIDKLKNKTWSSPSVRLYLSGVLLEKADLTAGQVMDLIDVIYQIKQSLDVDAGGDLLMTLVRCLPPEAQAIDIFDELHRRGWYMPLSKRPLDMRIIEDYVRFVADSRKQGSLGRGRIKFSFPIKAVNLNIER